MRVSLQGVNDLLLTNDQLRERCLELSFCCLYSIERVFLLKIGVGLEGDQGGRSGWRWRRVFLASYGIYNTGHALVSFVKSRRRTGMPCSGVQVS